MPQLSPDSHLVRFGEFELDLRSGELRRRGVKVSLQGQPFQVLTSLVQHAREIVTRDELRKQLWPRDNVGFQDGLNTAIRKVRKAVKDSAKNPQFIETLPRRGYRFMVPVEGLDGPARAVEGLTGPARVVEKTEKVLLAVLPFKNLSTDAEQEFFSAGMTGEMIDRLGMISPGKLGVIAETSVKKYVKTEKSVAEIGQELGVDYVVEGSVWRAGTRIRISAGLNQVTDQTRLWAGSYKRSLTDVFAVQSEVAESIAGSLAVELLPGRNQRAVNPSVDAYDQYLKGRYFWNKRREETLKKAIDYFNQAIGLDPGYAQAYAGLADCYAMLGWNSMLPPDSALPKAEAAAAKAVELNNTLADAHASLAFCRMFHEWDWAQAEREFKRAFELNPSYPVARPWYAFELSALGRHAEASAEVRRALQLDPFSLAIGASAGLVLSLAGQHDEAIQQCLKTVEMEPTGFYQTHFVLGASYAAKGMFDEAVRSLETAVKLSNRNPHMVAALGNTLAASGLARKARELIGELRERAGERYVSPYNIAMIYAGLRQKDKAFAWLQKAYDCRSLWLVFLNVHPMFEGLRPDPRFKSLVSRMGLSSSDHPLPTTSVD